VISHGFLFQISELIFVGTNCMYWQSASHGNTQWCSVITALIIEFWSVMFCCRFSSGTMKSCLGIYPSCFATRTTYTKALRHVGSVTTRRIARNSSLVLGGSAIITGTLYASLYRKSRVLCRAKSWTRTVELESSNADKEHQFPWKEFLKLLLPDIWHLLGAILVWSFDTIIFCKYLCFTTFCPLCQIHPHFIFCNAAIAVNMLCWGKGK